MPANSSEHRVIGRILSLGFPLPGPQVDNYNFLRAPSFFDYDALVIDPNALSQLIEGVLDSSVEALTFDERRVRNEPEAPTDVPLGDLLLRRREETRLALERGALVVSFAHPAIVHRGIAGAGDLDDCYWLPMPGEAVYGPPAVVPAEGSRAHVVDYEHPLAAFVEGQRANIAYRVRFETGSIAQFAERGRVFVRSEGGAAIGIDMAVAGGRVVLLPALKSVPAGNARYAMSDALQSGIRRALGALAEGRPPGWLASHVVPGLDERAGELAAARTVLDEARGRLDTAESTHDELARYHRLLWQEGAIGLEPVVLDALRVIGFELYVQDAAQREARAEGVRVLLEIEASEHAIGMAPHHRLRQRIERAIEQRREAPRGLLIVNGGRLQPPGQRTAQVSEELRIAAETMRYCVAPTAGLFDAVAAKLRADDDAVSAYRKRLVTEDGVLT